MAITTYPLNDIEYTAEDAELYNCTRNSGLYSGSDFTCTVNGTNNNVVIGEGVGWIRNGRFAGKVFANREAETIALDVADDVYPRIDVVGVRYETATNRTDIVVKKGTASANPVMPDIVQTETVYELYFYSVYREAAATVITADNVTDLRLDANYCGLMGDAITSIDTSAINEQFSALLAKIKKELADLKIGKIDAYSREETLSPSTKTLLGLSEDAVPDDAFNKLSEINLHWWKRRTEESGYELVLQNAQAVYIANNFPVTLYYGDSVTINSANGLMAIPNYSSITVYDGTDVSILNGKYFADAASANSVVYMGQAGIIAEVQRPESGGELRAIYYASEYRCEYFNNIGEYEYVSSPDRNAYPDSGTEGIFSYQYLGVPFENAREGAKIVTGSYVGTGTYGSSNPNSLTFDFTPKFVLLGISISRTFFGVNNGVENFVILPWGTATGFYYLSNGNASYYNPLVFEGDTMSWYNETNVAYQLNNSGTTYYYVAIG